LGTNRSYFRDGAVNPAPKTGHTGHEHVAPQLYGGVGILLLYEDEIRSVEGPDARSLTQNQKKKLDASHH
jgi:hypothetical protein